MEFTAASDLPRIDTRRAPAIGCGVRHCVLSILAATFLSSVASAQIWDRENVNFQDIENRAKELAGQPYVPPDKSAQPAWMKGLTYDQYRDIRFKPDQALWASENLPFRAMFFHPGANKDVVKLNEFTDSHQQQIRFAEGFFDYGPLVPPHEDMPPDAGFAGFRLHAPLNTPGYFDELVAFHGASYWRALGKGQRYGISARGLAVDTGAEGVKEEFPIFREFWLHKPRPDDKVALVYGLLDSPSFTGAYGFITQPGDDTVMTVRAVIFPRRAVKRLGIAPMSSMYWFGESSRRRFDDFRPEVHDSDGLAIRMGSGEKIWRPLSNDSGHLDFSFFSMEQCKGFGLLQRDRSFSSYQDGETAYQLRPSLWIEPANEWGPGKVMLMEIPTDNELPDNIVAMWEPDHTPQPGERLEFIYRQHWTMADDPAQAGGRVVATRTGIHPSQPDKRTVTIEFTGGQLDKWSGDPPTAMVEAIGSNADKVKIQGITVQPIPEGRWRVAFQLAPAADGGKLADAGPVELRCCLKKGDDFLTETWAYRVIP